MNTLQIVFLMSICCALGYSMVMRDRRLAANNNPYNTLWRANPNQNGIRLNQGQGQVNQYPQSGLGQGQLQGQAPGIYQLPTGFPGVLNNPRTMAQFQQFLRYLMLRNRRMIPGQVFTNDPRFPGGRGVVVKGDGTDGKVIGLDGSVTSVDGTDISREGGMFVR
ncbi:uncharacterized protein [Haliotis asinina]|uniref:uncharacterized protein n=1 Tax=Haliotis asinina TaxID=109174 RepID=UPI003531B2A1